jgi:TetR/AcrR family transcriptional regulator
MVKHTLSTEEKILAAAKTVFHRKGFEGTRMQEIADEAEINKALLHYYFRSKEKLFQAVFEAAFSGLMENTKQIFFSKKPLKEKISAFLVDYINTISENSYIPWFILNGMYERPEQLKTILEKNKINPLMLMEHLKEQIHKEYNADINPFHIWLNILSMSVFPVVAKPFLMEVFKLNEEAYNQILKERKSVVPQFVNSALKAYEKID